MKKLDLLKIVIVLLIVNSLLSCNHRQVRESYYQPIIDSIQSSLKKTYTDTLSFDEKKEVLLNSYDYIKSNSKDSIKANLLCQVAYRFYQLDDTIEFKKINDESLEIAHQLNNHFLIADAHWSYADLYQFREIYDKSYYHYNIAYKNFNKTDKRFETARMLWQMSFIKGSFHDYTGAEVLVYKAIKIYESLNDLEQLFNSYNHLGILQIDIEEYDKAIEYFNKSIEYAKELKNDKLIFEVSYNNMGLSYLKEKKYKKAIKYFNLSLSKNKDIANYARLLDNRAYSRLSLNDTSNVKNDFFEALAIRDSLNNKSDILINKIRISEYYEYLNDTTNALKYANEAIELAKEIKNGIDYLTCLKQLADLQPLKSNEYLHLYSNFRDSLLKTERKTLNKFTRIEFETDKVIEQNRTLGQRMIWIISGSIALLIFLSLLYFIRVQRVKNEKLFLETEQQKANEQVYLLTLKQQATLEEERTKERNRISQELHDGILGRLFGTRVGLGFLDFEADEQTQEQHEAFLEELQDIEKEIREVSHKLNDNFTDPDVNFTTIVTQLLESKSQIGDFQFHLNIDENISWKQTDEIIKVNVYRIIQETLQNTIKHANAKNVTLDFSTSDSQLWVQIMDDGVGFNLKKSRKGIGLKNMKSRVEKLNGSLEIQSAVNKGTQIHIKIPLV